MPKFRVYVEDTRTMNYSKQIEADTQELAEKYVNDWLEKESPSDLSECQGWSEEDGESSYEVRPELTERLVTYQVIVGNIGTVYGGTDKEDAESNFNVYVEQSKSRSGRVGGEQVTLLKDGELAKEYTGPDVAMVAMIRELIAISAEWYGDRDDLSGILETAPSDFTDSDIEALKETRATLIDQVCTCRWKRGHDARCPAYNAFVQIMEEDEAQS